MPSVYQYKDENGNPTNKVISYNNGLVYERPINYDKMTLVEKQKYGRMISKENGNEQGPPTYWTEERVTLFLNELIDWMEADDDNCFILEFINKKRISSGTYQSWKELYPNLLPLFNVIKEKQESVIVRKAMFNKANSSFAQFYLKNKHNYQDKFISENHNLPISFNINLPEPKEVNYIDLKDQKELPPSENKTDDESF